MPQDDPISSCTGGDGKISCETLAAAANPPPPDDPDLPPESFLLSKEAELDWIDQNAVIERKDSAKANGGSVYSLNLYHLNPTQTPNQNPRHPNSNPSSQRYSFSSKSKPSIIIGLPKSQKTAYAEATNRRRSPAIRLFPKRSANPSSCSSPGGGGGKSAIPMAEPSSPKVSCIGRVRSRRERSRWKKNQQKSSEPAAMRRSKSFKSHKHGFWTSFRSIFRSRGRKSSPSSKDGTSGADPVNDPPAAVKMRRSHSVRKRKISVVASISGGNTPAVSEAPSLGAAKRFSSGRRSDAWAEDMEDIHDGPSLGAAKRFSSGRRSDAWAEDLEDIQDGGTTTAAPSLGAVKGFSSGRRSDAWAGDMEAVDAVKSEPSERGTIWERRRKAGPPGEVDVDRRWEAVAVGPVSV